MFRAAYRRIDTDPASGGGRSRRAKVGLVLGAGAARGWAHIGALRELDALGLKLDVIVGSSIGTLVGGCYAAGRLDMLEAFARSLTRRRVLGLLDFSFTGSGLIGGQRLRARLEAALGDLRIEDLPVQFAAVATEIGGGHEIWLRRGLLVDAIRASYALPGVFEPVKIDGRWLFDGAIVNPVPVSVARALGAERVIALNISSDRFGRGTAIQDPFGRPEPAPAAEEPPHDSSGMIARWWRGSNGIKGQRGSRGPRPDDLDGQRLRYSPGPHHALEARRRSAGRSGAGQGRQRRHVRVPPRRRIDRARPRGGPQGGRRNPGARGAQPGRTPPELSPRRALPA